MNKNLLLSLSTLFLVAFSCFQLEAKHTKHHSRCKKHVSASVRSYPTYVVQSAPVVVQQPTIIQTAPVVTYSPYYNRPHYYVAPAQAYVVEPQPVVVAQPVVIKQPKARTSFFWNFVDWGFSLHL